MLILVLIYLLFAPPHYSCVHPNMGRIPPKDKFELELFFDYLMHNSMIGYTLCGDKPVSIESFPSLSKMPPQNAVNVFVKHPGYFILWKGWLTWERYSHLFPSDNIVIRFISSTNTMVIINKKRARIAIEENLDLFRRSVGADHTTEEILEEICRPNKEDYLIGKNCILLGILLGYGRNNAVAFGNKSYIQRLEFFNPYNAAEAFDPFLNPGLMVIRNGTNERENARIRSVFNKAKKNIQSEFKDGKYLDKVVEILTRQ